MKSESLRPAGYPGHALVVAICLATMLSITTDAAQASKARKARVSPAAAAGQPNGSDYSRRDDVREFIRDVSERHGFSEADLLPLFDSVRRADDVIRLIAPPPRSFKRSWAVYRARFLDPRRVEEGLAFWRQHADAVSRAAQRYGVPPEIIMSIIGVETFYGRITGDFRVLDALTVLAFDYPRRAAFFRGELEQFLLLARENAMDARTVKGSFAGAIGLPQFMPGSVRRYAVDFDADGRIDLRDSPVDAIGSVARFLAEHGWRSGEPTHFSMRFEDERRLRPLIEAGIEPAFTLDQMGDYGVRSDDMVPQAMPLALIDLPNGDAAAAYLLGARNFYVITRYNRSSFYAMAVIELARALREGRGDVAPISPPPATGSPSAEANGRVPPAPEPAQANSPVDK